jgi:hypothetical protein
MQDKQEFGKTRQYHRVKYPLFYQPKIKIREEENENDIVELSERGVRFLYEGTRHLSNGLELCVTIIFYDGEVIQCAGKLLRVEKKNVIMRFSGNLPLSIIIKEQRYLRNRTIGHL